jgi:hypothetical protein
MPAHGRAGLLAALDVHTGKVQTKVTMTVNPRNRTLAGPDGCR